MKKIILTGGGTAGHVTPNIAMIPKLKEMGYDISYIGTHNGIEKQLIKEIGIPYYGISSGKLRRYFDLKNFTDPFRVLKGGEDARKVLEKVKPDIIFSKGGFVTVPVILAAHHKKIPIVIHESDMSPGLANKIALPRATKICCNFPETKALFDDKAIVTGTPIRQELFSGNADKAFKFCGFTEKKPTILIVGGSTGSVVINEAIRASLDDLLKTYNIIHICGKDKTDDAYENIAGYKQLAYVGGELPDLFKLADLVISRAGANAICELLALRKPNILIPLSLAASRGDQILNANSFKKSGYSYVIEEEELSKDTLLSAVNEVYENRDKYIDTMNTSSEGNAIDTITSIIDSLV